MSIDLERAYILMKVVREAGLHGTIYNKIAAAAQLELKKMVATPDELEEIEKQEAETAAREEAALEARKEAKLRKAEADKVAEVEIAKEADKGIRQPRTFTAPPAPEVTRRPL